MCCIQRSNVHVQTILRYDCIRVCCAHSDTTKRKCMSQTFLPKDSVIRIQLSDTYTPYCKRMVLLFGAYYACIFMNILYKLLNLNTLEALVHLWNYTSVPLQVMTKWVIPINRKETRKLCTKPMPCRINCFIVYERIKWNAWNRIWKQKEKKYKCLISHSIACASARYSKNQKKNKTTTQENNIYNCSLWQFWLLIE